MSAFQLLEHDLDLAALPLFSRERQKQIPRYARNDISLCVARNDNSLCAVLDGKGPSRHWATSPNRAKGRIWFQEKRRAPDVLPRLQAPLEATISCPKWQTVVSYVRTDLRYIANG